SPYDEEYIESFNRQCLRVRQLTKLTTPEFQELGIRIGHRVELVNLAEEFVMKMSKRAALVERKRRRQALLMRPDGQHDELEGSICQSTPRNALSRQNTGLPSSGSLSIQAMRNSEGVEWISITGWCPTLEKFLYETSDVLTCYGFPVSAFHRFFFDNKPMPFVEFGSSFSEGPLVGLLLRVPDITNTNGSSVTVITNRLVILISTDENLIISFQRMVLDTGEQPFMQEWEEKRHDHCDVGNVLERMMRKQLRLYEIAVGSLRDTMDQALSLTDEVVTVQQLTLVMKKASVFKRCATASRIALEELLQRPVYDLIAQDVRTVCDRYRTVESLCEELETNALSSIDLNIALAEFRSSTNLKIFTYITIVAQPVCVATGWYGMNFTVMPELEDPNAYYIFAGVVWFCAFAFLGLFLIREHRLLRLRAGSKAKGGDDDDEAGPGGEGPGPLKKISSVADSVMHTLANALANNTGSATRESMPKRESGTGSRPLVAEAVRPEDVELESEDSGSGPVTPKQHTGLSARALKEHKKSSPRLRTRDGSPPGVKSRDVPTWLEGVSEEQQQP
ncbi:metal ion transporter (CorA), putative, partial [Bodo saltans]